MVQLAELLSFIFCFFLFASHCCRLTILIQWFAIMREWLLLAWCSCLFSSFTVTLSLLFITLMALECGWGIAHLIRLRLWHFCFLSGKSRCSLIFLVVFFMFSDLVHLFFEFAEMNFTASYRTYQVFSQWTYVYQHIISSLCVKQQTKVFKGDIYAFMSFFICLWIGHNARINVDRWTKEVYIGRFRHIMLWLWFFLLVFGMRILWHCTHSPWLLLHESILCNKWAKWVS